MITYETLRKARLEAERLNRELRELHLTEERCKLQRSRLEADRAQVQALLDVCELAQRLTPVPIPPFEINGRQFHVEQHHGAQLVIADKPSPSSTSRQKGKPDGLPSVRQMVLGVLEGEEAGMRQRDILKIAQQQWWPDLRPAAVANAVWKLTGEGRLEKDGHLYKLNGHVDG